MTILKCEEWGCGGRGGGRRWVEIEKTQRKGKKVEDKVGGAGGGGEERKRRGGGEERSRREEEGVGKEEGTRRRGV